MELSWLVISEASRIQCRVFSSVGFRRSELRTHVRVARPGEHGLCMASVERSQTDALAEVDLWRGAHSVPWAGSASCGGKDISAIT